MTKNVKMIVAMTASVSVSEAQRMLKIVAKLVLVGLAKAFACGHGHLPQIVDDGRMGTSCHN